MPLLPSLALSLPQLRKPPSYIFASATISLGGFLFGFDTGIIGPITTMPAFTTSFGRQTPTVHGLIVSTILIPAALASFWAGHLADAVGRTKGVMIGALTFTLGTALEASAQILAMLIMGRVIAGLGEGLFLSTLVVYICEISPPSTRGPVASLVQFATTLGLALGFFICYGSVNISTPESLAWRLPFVLQSLAALALAAACPFLPPSPRWLIAQNRAAEVPAAFARLGLSQAAFEAEVASAAVTPSELDGGGPEPAALRPVYSNQVQRKATPFLRVFRRDARKQALLGIFLMSMAQFSGIDGVLYYAPILFSQAGLSTSQATFLASGVSGLLIMLVTIPGSLLSDHWDRRTSAISGGLGLAIPMLVIGTLYATGSVHADEGAARWVVVVAIYVFAVAYSVTWAVGFKLYTTELQPAATRAAASSLAQSANWGANWIVAFSTPVFLERSAFGAYFFFGGCSLLTAGVCWCFMPETRRRSLDWEVTGNGGFYQKPLRRLVDVSGRGIRARVGRKREEVDQDSVRMQRLELG